MADAVKKAQLGVCYYPEQWPQAQWAQDAQRMVEAGLRWVRIGEFAWSKIEPSAGRFEWDWLDRVIDVLGEAGLQVVLGTPSAAPPRWMIDKYPDMLAIDAAGRPRKFGSRRHYCFSHTGYCAEAVRIAAQLAKRYGAHEHVQAWQLDNEYGCHDTVLSYSAAARDAFRQWLTVKYPDAATLNKAWGNAFWSMEYTSLAQVELPDMTVCEPNPAHVMDFRRFSSEQVEEFNQTQAIALREHTSKPLIHNYMGGFTGFDHYRVGADLDIAAWDSYPLGFLSEFTHSEAHKLRYCRQGDPDFQAFHHDLYRAVGKGRWWVMEQQPGPVNWAQWNPAPLDGMVRLWSWEAIAHGAEVVSYFRWRQASFAQEQMHAGLLRCTGAPAPGLAEAKLVAGEIDDYGAIKQQPSAVALVYDYESAWAWQTQPQGADFDYFRLCFDIYSALRRLGLEVDFVSAECESFKGRELVVIPALMHWNASLQEAMEYCLGVVLGVARTGSKTRDMAIPPAMPPGMLGLDCQVVRVESLRPGCEVALDGGGAFVRWFEHLETKAEVLERTVDGSPALVAGRRRYYLGGWPDAAALQRILGKVAQQAGLATIELPEGLRRRETATHTFWFNYDAKSVEFNEREFAPASVSIDPK